MRSWKEKKALLHRLIDDYAAAKVGPLTFGSVAEWAHRTGHLDRSEERLDAMERRLNRTCHEHGYEM